jgi:hypothetical protein
MEEIEQEHTENVETEQSRIAEAAVTEPAETEAAEAEAEAQTGDRGPTPGDVLRTLPTEAQQRGTRFISAQAMQAKLFSVYDAAAAAEDALALVQHQLTLTLNRSYYDADEIESMASQLDSLLALDTMDLELEQLDRDDLVSEG